MLNRAIKLPFTLLGIPLLLDWSFLILLPLLAWLIGSEVRPMAKAFGLPGAEQLAVGSRPYVLGLIAAVGLFVGVILHELGHAVTARAYGVKVKSITLWFLGGLARFEQIPRLHAAEAVISIVGPLVSFALGVICWILLHATPAGWVATRFVLAYLTSMNLLLGAFNLIPALPLDGGRVLRSLLTLWLGFGRATEVAGRVSQALAIVIGLFGFMSGNFFLLAIAVFVFFGVTGETGVVRVEELLRDLSVRQLMSPHVSTVPPEVRISELPNIVWQQRHSVFPVVTSDGHVLGAVSLDDAQTRDPSTPIGQIMHNIGSVGLTASAADVFAAMSKNGFGGVVVTDVEGHLAGIVTKTDLMRAMQLRQFGSDMSNPPMRHVFQG